MTDRLITRLLFCLLLLAPLAGATETGSTSQPPLRVGITEVPPFVIADGKGGWEGISIDLWRSIAEQKGWAFEFRPMGFTDLLQAVESGEIDIAVGALTMTSEREQRFDFSHPFYQTGLSIAVARAPKSGLLQSLRALFSWGFLSVVGGLALLLLAAGTLLWLFAGLYLPICWLSLASWVYVGVGLRRLVQQPRILRGFNRVLALLLAGSCVFLLLD